MGRKKRERERERESVFFIVPFTKGKYVTRNSLPFTIWLKPRTKIK